MAYLLDSNIFIAAMKAHPLVRARLELTPAENIILSPIVLGEVEVGVEKSAQLEQNRSRLSRIVDGFALHALDAETSRAYGRIRADLEGKGTPIGANDLWIAAQALALNAVLVTDNVREFSRVDGLSVENWLQEA